MAKLKLNLDDLRIKSFETTPEVQGASGTVHGMSACGNTACGQCTNLTNFGGGCGNGTYGCLNSDAANQTVACNYWTWGCFSPPQCAPNYPNTYGCSTLTCGAASGG